MSIAEVNKLHVSPSPHVFSKNSTQRIMLDVLIALAPAMVGSAVFFGIRALLVIAVSVLSCVVAEFAFQKLMKRTIAISDLSAVVTGVLLAFNMPSTVPLYLPVIGAVIAIILCKEIFGGIGSNFINPALAARVVLSISWPQQMTAFIKPFAADAVSSVTPLASIKASPMNTINITDLLTGNRAGCLGEVSVILLLIGFIYLLFRKVIEPRITVSMLGSIALFAFVFAGSDGLFTARLNTVLVHLFSGGAVLGACFMATDYVTHPVSKKGKWIFGIGCGMLTMVLRLWGSAAEAASYAILLMNVASPLIDRFTRVRSLGSGVKRHA